jgi:hypothetical protein
VHSITRHPADAGEQPCQHKQLACVRAAQHGQQG